MERPLSEKKAYLRDLTKNPRRADYHMQSAADSQKAVACKDMIRILLEHKPDLSPLEGASGSTFLELSLAAHLGWRDVFYQLLLRGAPSPVVHECPPQSTTRRR